MDLTQLLINAQSTTDAAAREVALTQLTQLEEQNLVHLLGSLCGELRNEAKPVELRQLAGIMLKNAVAGRSEGEKARRAQRWMVQVPPEVRNHIKQTVVQVLASNQRSIRGTAAQLVSKIAAIEIPHKQWLEIVDLLVGNITGKTSDDIKQSSLEALGFICEEVPDPLQAKSVPILIAIATGMNDQQTNNDIKLAATTCLLNSLDFVRGNFANKKDRDTIMQMVFSASQFKPEEQVRVKGLECLVEIGASYYEYLNEYIEATYKLTAHAIANESEDVALMAIEFWSTICEEETEILEEAQAAAQQHKPSPRKCHNFMKTVLPHFMPMILQCLAKQSDDPNDDSVNRATAAGNCLKLIAMCTKDAVVEHVLPFVQLNIQNPNWHLREAAILSFGSILEGPSQEKLMPVVTQAFPLILHQMQDASPQVKDTAAWTIGRICEVLPDTLADDMKLERLMHQLVVSLRDAPRIAAHVCWAIYNVANNVDPEQPASVLSKYFEGLIRALFAATDRKDVDQGNLLTSAYEAINALIGSATKDMNPLLGRLIPTLIEKLKSTLMREGLSADEREKLGETQGFLCSALTSVVTKLDASVILPHCDMLMELFLRVLSSKAATVHEEALMAIGSIAGKCGANFEKYIPVFKPLLLLGLQNASEHHVCIVSVGVVSEICSALQKKIAPHCDEIMQALLHNLQNPHMERSVKPYIISCLADVAINVEGYFERYLPYVMMMLVQASAIKFENMDEDSLLYLITLQESILEAYTGILQGLTADHKENSFLQFVDSVVGFLDTIAASASKAPEDYDNVIKAGVGVAGDLAHCLGSKVKQHLHRPAVHTLLQLALRSEDKDTLKAANWTKDELAKL